MRIWAVGIALGMGGLIAAIRAIKRAIYYGTAPPLVTDTTDESTNISRDRGDHGGRRVRVTLAEADDGRDFSRVAPIRDDAVRGHCVRRTRER